MFTMDKVETIVLSAEEEEMEQQQEEEEEGVEGEDEVAGDEEEGEAGDEEEKVAGDEEEKVAGDKEEDQEEGKHEDDGQQENGVEKKEEAVPQAAVKTKMAKKKKNPFPAKTKEKRPDEVLNLNNEVVRMRKEVKRVRALIIRKLLRQIAALKKKKGKEMEIERNQRRAARLLEEIQAMKVLSPDVVTKTALQKNLNFDQACKDPKCTISDRAMARIATHPQFKKKIETIKAAVKAFKEERMKAGKQGLKEKVQNKPLKVTPQTPDKKVESKIEKVQEEITVEQQEVIEDEKVEDIIKDSKEASVAGPEVETVIATPLAEAAAEEIEEILESKIVKLAEIKISEAKDNLKNKPIRKVVEKKPELKPAAEVLHETKDEEESDLELSDDEEKEYFDDSTEERFHKQSSHSEESDDDGGFFVGKVSKYKKKRKPKSGDGVRADEQSEVKSSDRVQSELDELESRLKSKKNSLQSVFCPSLSTSKPGGGRGGGRGRGGDRFMGRGNSRGGSGPNRDFRRDSKFQNQEEGAERNSRYSKPCPEASERGFSSGGRGRGRGRGDFMRQNDRRGGGGGGGRGGYSQQPPQQALHPSWEASKKRKEQQGQILAFQGKKIKFDD